MEQDVPLNDMQQYLVDEFIEEYQEGRLTRRQVLRQLTLIIGSSTAAGALVAACASAPSAPASTPAATTAPTSAAATAPTAGGSAASPTAVAVSRVPASPAATAGTVSATDPAITGAGMVEFDGPAGTLMGYQARPAGTEPRPLLIVIHENRGLTEHIQDVARRAAKAGYIALAPDLLSRAGGTATFTDPQRATGAIGQLVPEDVIADLKAAISYLQGLEGGQSDRLGATGFCWGGGQTWRLITQAPEVGAAVPFYGPAPALDQVKNIRAAVLGIYAGNDQRINANLPQLEQALQEANVTYQIKIYPGVNHAFHNDTGANYAPEAAQDAWAQAIAWLDRHLKG